jgi:hypothetical protein
MQERTKGSRMSELPKKRRKTERLMSELWKKQRKMEPRTTEQLRSAQVGHSTKRAH